MERRVKMVLGDWGGDGHSITETIVLKLSGDDVSNLALSKSRAAATEETGVDIAYLFEDYEVSAMPLASAKAILEAGMTFEDESSPGPAFWIDGEAMNELVASGYFNESYKDTEGYFSVVALLMAYLSFGVEGLTYEIDEDLETIVGGYGNDVPFTRFGYGFYGN